MIRITQSYIIRKIEDYLRDSGWVVLYTDYPQGPRSGMGVQSVIHKILETQYDRAPDILAYKNGDLLLIEVNDKLEQRYLEKFLEFNRQSRTLISELAEKLDLEITELKFGFGMKKRKIDLHIKRPLTISITVFYLDSNHNIIENKLNAIS